MASSDSTQSGKKQVLVVLELNGGNDFMNTVIPYGDPLYHDYRRTVGIPEDDVLRIDERYGFHPAMGPLKELWDQGKVASVAGVGYPNPNRSHFRSMDIWHTCEPDEVASEGWLGRTVRELDPRSENPLTAVSIGAGLPRALAVPGVAVSSVAQLDTYGLLTDIDEEVKRKAALELFRRMYAPAIGKGPVNDYIRQTGRDALRGADAFKVARANYSSDVEYAENSIAQSLKGVSQVHLANLGTRIFYTQYAGFDVHANEVPVMQKLWTDVSGAIYDFYSDLREHHASEEVVMLVFTEFGRRVRDNGSGTDHGSGGGAFIIGDPVKGGMYAEYPSLAPEKQIEGDLQFSYDFRGLYSSILGQWLELDPVPIVNGTYEQLRFLQAA